MEVCMFEVFSGMDVDVMLSVFMFCMMGFVDVNALAMFGVDNFEDECS